MYILLNHQEGMTYQFTVKVQKICLLINWFWNLLMDIKNNGRAVIMATHNHTLLKKFPGRTFKCEKDLLIEINQAEEIDFSSLMEE